MNENDDIVTDDNYNAFDDTIGPLRESHCEDEDGDFSEIATDELEETPVVEHIRPQRERKPVERLEMNFGNKEYASV